MSQDFFVTVVLSTYNRSKLLGPAIRSLLQQSAGTPPYEIVIVDNNSADDTRAVVEECAASAAAPLRYLFEPRQGLSYARNTGIAAARAGLVAFTDDDVRVADDWVRVIQQAFAAHPEVDCLGGRTRPVWPSDPPRWLTPLHWVGPLALQDYGEEPFIVDAQRAVCLAGANLAFRKSAFDRIGLFSPEFRHAQDTELLVRFWASGARALYVPNMLTYAAVQSERLHKAYHREWHSNIGRWNAHMALEELTGPGGALRSTRPTLSRFKGVPLFTVRRLAHEVLWWFLETARRREARAFWHETQARGLSAYIRESAALHRRRGGQPAIPEPADAVDAETVASTSPGFRS